jgi:hypothetical protein
LLFAVETESLQPFHVQKFTAVVRRNAFVFFAEAAETVNDEAIVINTKVSTSVIVIILFFILRYLLFSHTNAVSASCDNRGE